MTCCSEDYCNTDLLKTLYENDDEGDDDEDGEAEKSAGTKLTAKLGFIFCFAAVFFLA